MHLVGFIIRIFHDARSPECQTGYVTTDGSGVSENHSYRTAHLVLLPWILNGYFNSIKMFGYKKNPFFFPVAQRPK